MSKASAVILVCFFFCSCNATGDLELRGVLIYSNGGSEIRILDFKKTDIEPNIVYESPSGVATIQQISKIDNEIFVFNECSVISDCVIKIHNVDSSIKVILRNGRLPSYDPRDNRLYFYEKKPEEKRGWLASVNLKNPNHVTRLTKEPKRKLLPNGIEFSLTSPPVHVSSNRSAFTGEDGNLWLFDTQNSRFLETSIINCCPVVWRSETSQLLCQDWESWEVFLLNLDDYKIEELPELKNAYGFVYIEDRDALVYGRTRGRIPMGEGYDIFFYSFDKRQETKIRSNEHIQTGIWVSK